MPKTHLLRRVEEKGEISVYFTNTFDYLDYQEVRRRPPAIPYHSQHNRARQPRGRPAGKEITHNVTLKAEMFSKPMPGQVVLGGKR